jgi:hypothetical protein
MASRRAQYTSPSTHHKKRVAFNSPDGIIRQNPNGIICPLSALMIFTSINRTGKVNTRRDLNVSFLPSSSAYLSATFWGFGTSLHDETTRPVERRIIYSPIQLKSLIRDEPRSTHCICAFSVISCGKKHVGVWMLLRSNGAAFNPFKKKNGGLRER